MGLVEPYFHSQIAHVGFWNDETPAVIIRLQEESGRADDAWLQRTLAQMRKLREPGTKRYVFPGKTGSIDIDIRLIDAQVYFNGYSGKLTGSPMTDENFRQVDQVCGGRVCSTPPDDENRRRRCRDLRSRHHRERGRAQRDVTHGR
jgi:hypothetical protein